METLSSRLVYENKWLRVREDRIVRANGAEGIYSVVDKRPCAIVLPWDGERITMIEQFRYPHGARFWEFPAGALDDTDDLHHEETIAREELAQETGLIAGRMTFLGAFQVAPGITSQVCHAFLAENLTPGDTRPDEEEVDLVVRAWTVAEFWEMVAEGQIADSLTLAAMALWMRRLSLAEG